MMERRSLSATLPSLAADAKLPATYETAKTALARCVRIDECAEWANKAEALASYAKQAGDATLRNTADRIQARAIRRCGELLRAIKRPDQGGRPPARNGRGTPTVSRRQAAAQAGLSKDQQITAVRVARVPESTFEAAVEADHPPTVTKLAAQGTTPRRESPLKGRPAPKRKPIGPRLGHLEGAWQGFVESGFDGLDPAERQQTIRLLAKIERESRRLRTRLSGNIAKRAAYREEQRRLLLLADEEG